MKKLMLLTQPSRPTIFHYKNYKMYIKNTCLKHNLNNNLSLFVIAEIISCISLQYKSWKIIDPSPDT